jgi:hypothetical protein
VMRLGIEGNHLPTVIIYLTSPVLGSAIIISLLYSLAE